jgi:hypothetical protein
MFVAVTEEMRQLRGGFHATAEVIIPSLSSRRS